MIRTKILATIGPACANVDTLSALFEAGADACRLNFSHGSIEQHQQMLLNIRSAAKQHGHPISILGDLGGPKIRLGPIRDFGGTGGLPVNVGDDLIFARGAADGEGNRVSTSYPNFVDDVQVGDRILIEDGLLRFFCTEKTNDELHCRATAGGVLKSGKGINLPNTNVNLPAITERDWGFSKWAIDHDLDYLALSFVRRPGEVKQLRDFLQNHGSDIHLISKIEKAEAIENIEAILECSDGLMIARGDLGVELDPAQVPIIQKDLIKRCLTAGKPVIVATQMLQSMIESSSPTRAEVSDVANAIFDGTDVVMLSGETAVGKFPVGAVHIMSHIADVTETYISTTTGLTREPLRLKTMHLSAAVANGVRQIVCDLATQAVVVYSQSGATARILSKARIDVPVIALSSDPRALRRMALYWGVFPNETTEPPDMSTLVERVDRLVQEKSLASIGQRIVIVAGASLGTPGTMNGIMLYTVGGPKTEAIS